MTAPASDAARPSGLDHHVIAAFLAIDGRADRVAAEHTADESGRCRCCPAGPQRGRVNWPCTLATLAELGREMASRTTSRAAP